MNELDRLKAAVCVANRDLWAHGLAPLTWGNVSGITSDRLRVVIKPSGVSYDRLSDRDMVVVDLAGNVIQGALRPSTDTLTHLAIYRAFPTACGIVHTHSPYATSFAQARMEIPCLGTTHADHFHGPIPVTRQLRDDEMSEYEASTGRVIVERFASLDAATIPAVLVAGHAPFVWGTSADNAVENAIALEAIARMAIATLSLNPQSPALESYILNKHHERKHGAKAYYGQRPPPAR